MAEGIETYQQAADLLLELEIQLRRLDLWQAEPPSANALASQQPFCIDTLSFPQWLQFVFVVRIKALIESQAQLPSSSAIVPMAEEYFRGQGLDSGGIIAALKGFDSLLSLD